MTAQADRKVPPIRFKEFEADWESATFGENIISIQTGTNLLGSISENGTPLLKMGNIQRGFFSFERIEYLSSNMKVEAENIAQHGDFLFNTRNTLDLVGKGATWMGESGKFAFNSNLARFKFQGVNTVFFNYLYNTSNVILQVKARAMGTTSVAAIYPKNLSSLKYALPAPNEQTQIGNYFQNLDSLISQHQHKHDKLLTLKKAMLQKMFPQAGAATPEIRFAGFVGDWVEKRLDEISEIVGGGTPSTSIPEYWGGDIDWYSPTEIGNDVYACGSVKKITPLGFSKSSARFLPPFKTVLFTSRAGIGDMAILTKEGCTNQGFQSMVVNDDTDPYFLYSMGHLIKVHALKHASGSTFLEVSSKQLGKMKIHLPEKIEQQKIGTYFRTLDTLIAQHAVQLQKLKQIKSACLARMFV